MTSIFSGLQSGAIRQPDSVFNSGPLPSTENGPAGVDGDPDGKYNFNTDLLSGIQPYAYGESYRMGSDRNYQQIPHRVQQLILQLFLPHADLNQQVLVPVSHSVDQGDVAFLIRSSQKHQLLFDLYSQQDASLSNKSMPARNAFCNLTTVNYLLAGLQRLRSFPVHDKPSHPWVRLAKSFNFDTSKLSDDELLQQVLLVCRQTFIPFGICAGSEQQGGKHETGMAPVQSAVNHVTTMTVDGQNRDLVNLWRRDNIEAGDQLIFRLEYLPTQTFTLNHYYKGTVHQRFSNVVNAWQLVPDLFRMNYEPGMYQGLRSLTPIGVEYDYRRHGYWRIGQTFQHRAAHDVSCENYSNDLCFMRGQLLQVTFAPMWYSFEEVNIARDKIATGGHTLVTKPDAPAQTSARAMKISTLVKTPWNPFKRQGTQNSAPGHFAKAARSSLTSRRWNISSELPKATALSLGVNIDEAGGLNKTEVVSVLEADTIRKISLNTQAYPSGDNMDLQQHLSADTTSITSTEADTPVEKKTLKKKKSVS